MVRTMIRYRYHIRPLTGFRGISECPRPEDVVWTLDEPITDL